MLKALVYFAFGIIIAIKSEEKHWVWLVILLTFLNIFNSIIFIILDSKGSVILNISFLDKFFEFILNFSKETTNLRGHFPYKNQTSYSLVTIIPLLLSLFVLKKKFLVYIIIFFSIFKGLAFFDKSLLFIILGTIIIYSFIIKDRIKVKINILIIFLFCFSSIHFIQFYKDQSEYIDTSERYQINVASSHKVNHRVAEYKSIYKCGKLKKFFYNDLNDNNFKDCLKKLNLYTKQGSLFYHNIYLNILILSNYYILILIILLKLLILYYFLTEKKNKNLHDIVFFFIFIIFLSFDSMIVVFNLYFIYLGIVIQNKN